MNIHYNALMFGTIDTPEGPTRGWIKIGDAHPHIDGPGYNIQLEAFPRNGRILLLPPGVDLSTARDRDIFSLIGYSPTTRRRTP